jgi:RecA-family ATPase
MNAQTPVDTTNAKPISKRVLFPPTLDDPIVDHALHYAAGDWHVFPVPPGTKMGHTSADRSNGQPWGHTKDAEEIRGYWKKWPDANVGIVMGEKSGIFVVEADTKEGHDVDGIASLAKLEAEHEPLPATLQAESPSGSIHYYFRHPGFKIKNSASEIAPGVDVRGDGGMVVAPPSVKPGKGVYRWRNDLPIADAPQWLINRIVAGKETIEPEPEPSISQQAMAMVRDPYAEYGASGSFGQNGFGRAYLDKALAEERAKAAGTGEGQRNHQLNKSSFNLGQLVAHGLSEQEIISAMYDAATQNGHVKDEGHKATMNTINSGLKDGMANPRPLPEPKNPPKRRSAEVIQHPSAKMPDEMEDKPLPPLKWLDMSSWDRIPVPMRQWAIRDRVPLKQAGLFSGEGGTGKSIIELMKNIAHVTGNDWLGSLPEPGAAFYLGAEDDADEIHIRIAAIAKHYDVTFKELIEGGLYVLPLLGKDATLCAPSKNSGRIEVTGLYRQIYEAAGDIKPKNISIDTLSRAFAGNEIDRVQVYAFAMHMQALAEVANGSVTVLSHPSLAGINSGSGISGSTAWHGAFRFRFYLKSAKSEGGEQPDNDLREIEFKKNQYGPKGETLVLRYQRGLFLPEAGVSSLDKLAREAKADQVFLELLRLFADQGRNVSEKVSSNNYAPAAFAEDAEAKKHGLRKADFKDAMARLFSANRIYVENYGRPSRPASRLAVR